MSTTEEAPRKRKKVGSYKTVVMSGTVLGAIEGAVSDISDLASECGSARDNFPTQDHPKAQAFGEAVDALEQVTLDGSGLPESAADLPVQYQQMIPRRKRHAPSRATRLANAVTALEAAKDALESWQERSEERLEDDGDADVEQCVQELDEAIGAVDGVEFPGLYG